LSCVEIGALPWSAGLSAEPELLALVSADGSSLPHATIDMHSEVAINKNAKRLRCETGSGAKFDTTDMTMSPAWEGLPGHACAVVSDAAA
jgi:hypothetical protein